LKIAVVSDERICRTPDGSHYRMARAEWSWLPELLGSELQELRVYCRVFAAGEPPPG